MYFFSTVLALAAIPAAVLGSAHTVTVGAGGMLAFNPSNISAAVGDQVNFEFSVKNHSVTQSTFTSPCTKAMFNGTTGINSGFLNLNNVTVDSNSPPTWSIMVNDTTPLWFYCAQKIPVSHCQMGMVFSINATPQKSFDTFLATAKASNSTTASAAGASGSSNPLNAASSNTNGASRTVFTREAAGLLTVAAIGAVLL